MAISYVQGNYQGSSSSSVSGLSVAYPTSVTSGNLLIAAGGWTGTNTAGAVADTQGNTWQTAVTYNGGSLGYCSAIFYTIATATSGNTVTLTPGGAPRNFVRILVHEYSGADTLDVAPTPNSGASGTTAALTGITTNFANELIFAWPLFNAGTTSAGSGYTLRVNDGSEITEDDIVTTTGTYTAAATCTTSTSWSMVVATFYSSGGGGGTNAAAAPWISTF